MLSSALSLALTVGWLMLASPTSANAQPASPNDSYAYVAALTNSLGLARIGLHRYDGLNLGTPEGLVRSITAGRLAAGDYARAASVIEPFLKSRNGLITRSAEMAHSGYSDLTKAEQTASASWIQSLEVLQSGGKINVAEFAKRASDVNVARESGWERVVAASSTAHYSLVGYPQDPKAAASHLNITAAQRLGLLRGLERMFGVSIKHGLNDKQDSTEGCAAVIYKSISTMPLKPADVK